VTPLPWKLGPTQDTVDDANGRELVWVREYYTYEKEGVTYSADLPYAANAAFIVRAVNSHAELLAACKSFKQITESPLLATNKAAVAALVDQVERAIAKAEEAL
jgi:hypothetical protein